MGGGEGTLGHKLVTVEETGGLMKGEGLLPVP